MYFKCFVAGEIRPFLFTMENIIDKLIKEKMLYLVLGSMVSSDNLVDLESCNEAYEAFLSLEAHLKDSKLKDEKIEQYFKDCKEIIEKDIKNYSK